MCGIFGIIAKSKINFKELNILADNARQRGKDSSGYLEYFDENYIINRFDYDLKDSKKKFNKNSNITIGHSRLVTNSMADNQPLLENEICVFHNGIVTNFQELFEKYQIQQDLKIDTEIILKLFHYFLKNNNNLEDVVNKILKEIKGSASCVIHLISKGKIILFTNNGSLYVGKKNDDFYICSESFSLRQIKCEKIFKVKKTLIIDVPVPKKKTFLKDHKVQRLNLIPELSNTIKFEKFLKYENNDIVRCAKCVLPANFPFIVFDENGVCNFCKNYQKKYKDNESNRLNEFKKILEKYKDDQNNINCIMPLSGGRDSCYGLHIAVKEFGLSPITFTYDWGLVTDLARRNISRICATLNVENIIIADDLNKKRRNIKKNVVAWLKKPHLGMVNLFTAGDKHFYRFLDKVKKQNQIDLNIWSYNPFEITHFKHGYLDIKPNFKNKKTYNQGLITQLEYQFKRLKIMFENFAYFNTSIFDTLIGEYSRSIKKHSDYYYIFNYMKWNEDKLNKVLLDQYEWEKSIDTDSTWRIGDGAAPFYNYIYYTMVGFTEFDTFRSNQIREGLISRETALSSIQKENRPRLQSIKWFLDIIDLDFEKTIKRINEYSFQKNEIKFF